MFDMQEIWKEIDGYQGLYEVSSLGRVKSINKKWAKTNGRIMKPFLTTGYERISLQDASGDRKKYLVHRLVALAFIPNPENKPQVNHKNCIKSDNRLVNLEWSTPSENLNHAIANDRLSYNWSKGESNHASVLTDKIVLEIRDMNPELLPEFSRRNNLPHDTVLRAYRGETWKHLPNARDYKKRPAEKLSPDDVIKIRELIKKGKKHREIAPMFNVHQSAISKVATGLRWSHV